MSNFASGGIDSLFLCKTLSPDFLKPPVFMQNNPYDFSG
jgi:hypothetical protein